MEEQGKYRQNGQEGEVEGGEQQGVGAGLAAVLLGVLPVGDQAGKGCDQRANTADVYTQQQRSVILGELTQQNGGGYVADHLAGCHTYQEGVFLQQEAEQLLYCRDSCHITGENKEKHKG